MCMHMARKVEQHPVAREKFPKLKRLPLRQLGVVAATVAANALVIFECRSG